jgi:hypothetical protein
MFCLHDCHWVSVSVMTGVSLESHLMSGQDAAPRTAQVLRTQTVNGLRKGVTVGRGRAGA